MPIDFVTEPKLVFIRLKAASRLSGFLEVKLNSRFVVLIIGPTEQTNQLYEIGRAISICLADDVIEINKLISNDALFDFLILILILKICRELFYTAQSRDDLIEALRNFNKCVLVIPPSEWNPKIRIEPPDKYFSKVN
jgi:sodium bicarbonate cotransporter 5